MSEPDKNSSQPSETGDLKSHKSLLENKSLVDFLIVGAGIAGLVMAERLCASGWRCLIVDKRPHIGGNCYDYRDEHGSWVHKYGPHYFRTNSDRVFEYLSRFTAWRHADYRVLAEADGRHWSFPVNLATFEQMEGGQRTPEQFAAWLQREKAPIATPANSEEAVLAHAGPTLYRRFYLGYTLKQWKRHPRELSPEVCARLPIRTHRDERYFSDRIQALPAGGYTAMFEAMRAACGERLTVRLGVDYAEVREEVSHRHLIYTGAIDSFYGYRFGPLPYRSLRFETRHFTAPELAHTAVTGVPGRYWQPAVQVNYPNAHDYTRTVELKHLMPGEGSGSTVVFEYPEDYAPGRERYYPVPTPESDELYQRYATLAERETHVSFVGRLATYKYYNMDQVVALALAEADRLSTRSLDHLAA